jgi:EAL and modified HD-GYP domain-containing signal transduction protein
MGMLSLMDVILCRPLGEITESVPVDEDIKQSLNGESGLLYWILECARAYEEGDWSKLSMQVEHLGLLESRVLEIYREVMLWTQHDSRGLGYAA